MESGNPVGIDIEYNDFDDLIEFGVDLFLNDGVLKDIPFVNLIYGSLKTGATIRDTLFKRKLLNFLSSVGDTEAARISIFNKMHEKKERDYVIEQLIEAIDKVDSTRKSKLIGKIFVEFIKDEIDLEIMIRLFNSLKFIIWEDLKHLAESSSSPLTNNPAAGESLVYAGLAHRSTMNFDGDYKTLNDNEYIPNHLGVELLKIIS